MERHRSSSRPGASACPTPSGACPCAGEEPTSNGALAEAGRTACVSRSALVRHSPHGRGRLRELGQTYRPGPHIRPGREKAPITFAGDTLSWRPCRRCLASFACGPVRGRLSRGALIKSVYEECVRRLVSKRPHSERFLSARLRAARSPLGSSSFFDGFGIGASSSARACQRADAATANRFPARAAWSR